MDAGLKAFERYRPWLQLGLRHILLPEGSALTGSYVDVAATDAAPPATPSRPRPQPSAPVFPRRPKARDDGPSATPPADTPPVSPPTDDTGPDWSSIWRRYRSKLKVPSRTIWTYLELGQDMGDTPLDERRQLFARIMKALAWPPGCIGFWPVAFQCRGRLEPRRELFLRGMREAGAHTAVCFGRAAHDILLDDRAYDHGTTTLGDATVIVLPGPEDMLGPDADQAKRIVWERLKAYKPF